MEQVFQYFEFDPAPGLARHVTCYWGFRVRTADPPVHQLWPDGCMSLVWVVPAEAPPFAVVAGPRLRPFDVHVTAGAVYWGARLWPDAGGALTGIRAPELRDVVVRAPVALQGGLDALAAAGNEAEAAAALDALLLPLLRTAQPLDDAVRQAVVAIVATRGDASMSDIAARVGLGERQLQRRFRSATGLTMKQFARIRRLRESGAALLLQERPPWAVLAADFGYADQSHLIHEFSQLTGLTPVAFEDRLRQIEHGRVRP